MAASAISFATFNLFNLNRPGLPMYRDRDGWSDAVYRRKIAWTARMLDIGRADVWGFQEHWHNEALEEAHRTSALKDSHELLMPPGHAGEMIQCAGLVRRDILVGEPEWITGFPEGFLLASSGEDKQTPAIALEVGAFSRPVLTFVIKPVASKAPIRVFVCHFKSKAPTRIDRERWYDANEDLYKPHRAAIGAALSTIRRTAEATALRMILNDHLAGGGRGVVVLGDLNDGVNSNTLNIVSAQPGFNLKGRPSEGSDRGLYSVANLMRLRSERDIYYTHIYRSSIETLDHILVSEELYDLSRDREWGFDWAEILNDHLSRDDQKQTGTGDHGVVVAHFEGRSPLR